MNRNSKSFTLIEMIVVMAIILMLSLLIYSVTTKAIKSGEGIQCVSQARQLGQAMTMHLHDYGIYPKSARYASPGEEGSIVDALSNYIDDSRVYICPSSEPPFKEKQLSYIYNTEVMDELITSQWLLVDVRLPGSPNPHLGDTATVLWSDGHAKLEEVVLSE